MQQRRATGRQLEFNRCVIKPGYLAVSRDPAVIFSVCGCGVVVVIRDRIKKVGGLAYCLYPSKRWGERPTNFHADVAVSSLVRSLLGLNSYVEDMEAQVFGGASIRSDHRRRSDEVVNVCRHVLKKLRVNIVSEDVGGTLGRKILFNTHSGETAILKTRQVRKSDWVPELAMAS